MGVSKDLFKSKDNPTEEKGQPDPKRPELRSVTDNKPSSPRDIPFWSLDDLFGS